MIWQPKGNELLCCCFKKGNCYDRFAIKMCTENKRMVGHLPREVSWITKFIIDRGTKVKAELIGSHSCRSHLAKGRSENSSKVSVSMIGTCAIFFNKRYKQLTIEQHSKLKKEVMLGSLIVPVIYKYRKDEKKLKRNQRKKKNHNFNWHWKNKRRSGICYTTCCYVYFP